MGTVLWWAGNAAVVVVVVPAVALLAVRILRALALVEAAARDIRQSVASVAAGSPALGDTLAGVAAACERRPQPAAR